VNVGGGLGRSCAPGTADPSVNICTPSDGATLDSPVRIQAATNTSKTVTSMKIYLDGTSVYRVQAASIDTSLALTPGSHRITVKAWHSDETSFSQTINITVNETSAEVCTPGTADPSVNMCTPADGATLDSPVRVQAATNSSKPVTAMKIYVDGTSVYHVQASSIDTSLALTPGTHRITVKAWHSDGSNFSQTINVIVSEGT
jgi:post-segregation antitoxin (ccd killing protein)